MGDVAVWAVIAGIVAWKFAGKAAQLVSGTFVALLGTVVKAAVLIAPMAAIADRLLPGHAGGMGMLWAGLALAVLVAGAYPARVIKRELWPAEHSARVRWARRREYLADQWAAGKDWADEVADRRMGQGKRARAGDVPAPVRDGDRGEVGQARPLAELPRAAGRAGRAVWGRAGGVLGRRRLGADDRGARATGGGVDEGLAAQEAAGAAFRAAMDAAGIKQHAAR